MGKLNLTKDETTVWLLLNTVILVTIIWMHYFQHGVTTFSLVLWGAAMGTGVAGITISVAKDNGETIL